MKINFNMSAIISMDNLSKTENSLSSSIERLSSGFKINHAKDSPSGIAIAKKMHAQIRGLSKASQNASDGVSVIETAEGAMTEIHNMLQRMNQLTVKSANGTLSESERASIQEEVDALTEEIERITRTTEFNGSTLLDGTFDLKGYVEVSQNTVPGMPDANLSAIKVESYSDGAKAGIYEVTVEIKEIMEKDDAGNLVGTGKYCVDSAQISPTGTTQLHGKNVELQEVDNQSCSIKNQEVKYEYEVYENKDGESVKTKKEVLVGEDKYTATITANNSFSLTLDIDLKTIADQGAGNLPGPATGPMTVVFNVDLTGIGAMTTQIGANEGQVLDIRIPTVSPKTLFGVEKVNVSTKEDATASIDTVASAITNLSSVRSRLGAYQNRLEHTISSLEITEENMTGAYSRIMDTDMAEEMTEYTKDQILSQAGTSMLAQANQRPSQILQLLQ